MLREEPAQAPAEALQPLHSAGIVLRACLASAEDYAPGRRLDLFGLRWPPERLGASREGYAHMAPGYGPEMPVEELLVNRDPILLDFMAERLKQARRAHDPLAHVRWTGRPSGVTVVKATRRRGGSRSTRGA
jgi:hypothetical protein